MNKSNNILYDLISQSEIEITDSDEIVHICEKYTLINPIFFELQISIYIYQVCR